MKRIKNHEKFDLPDLDQLKSDLHSPDAGVCAAAIRSLCPCHSGWKPFEQHMKLIAELQKDADPTVRAAAMHVFEDAAEIESSGYPTNPREVSNEMLRTKRASRFPLDSEEIAERAIVKRRKHDWRL